MTGGKAKGVSGSPRRPGQRHPQRRRTTRRGSRRAGLLATPAVGAVGNAEPHRPNYPPGEQRLPPKEALMGTQAGPPLTSEDLGMVEVEDKHFKADHELLHDYQSFSSDILRASLSGIAVVGFLVNLFKLTAPLTTALLVLSVVLLGVSVGLALGHRYFSTKGFHYHLRVIRSNKSQTRQQEAPAFRARRTRCYKAAGYCFATSTVTFFAGAIALALAFICCIYLRTQ